MRILFDQGTPAPLKKHLSEHQVQTAFELDWSRLTNGDLLAAAVYVLHAFQKKTRKTGKPDIELARRRYKQIEGGS